MTLPGSIGDFRQNVQNETITRNSLIIEHRGNKHKINAVNVPPEQIRLVIDPYSFKPSIFFGSDLVINLTEEQQERLKNII